MQNLQIRDSAFLY